MSVDKSPKQPARLSTAAGRLHADLPSPPDEPDDADPLLAWDLPESGVDDQPGRLIQACLSTVEEQKMEWLWPGRIASGSLTLLVGDPGLGKSLLSLDMAARVSTGARWPDDSGVAPCGSVVLLTGEDNLGTTVRPRLDAAGADVTNVFAIEAVECHDEDGRAYRRSFDLGCDIPRLEAMIDRVPNCQLVVIDPISAYCGGVDTHKNADVRGLLAPLADLASRRRVAVVAISHLRKGEGQAIHSVLGSLAFVAVARAVWVIVRDSKDATRLLFLPVKNNLGNDRHGLAFRLSAEQTAGTPRVEWLTRTGRKTRQSVKSASVALDNAIRFLRVALANGEREAKDVLNESQHMCGIAVRTLRRARKAAGVVVFRREHRGVWWWRLG